MKWRLFCVTRIGAVCYTALGRQNKACSKPGWRRLIRDLGLAARLGGGPQSHRETEAGPESYSILLLECPIMVYLPP